MTADEYATVEGILDFLLEQIRDLTARLDALKPRLA
jgi:hypothetical protein